MRAVPIRRFAALLAPLTLAAPALAQEAYPSRPVTLVVTVAPGTVADIVARTIGPKLADRLKQPVVIENKVGASGTIGADFVAKAPPNGYTLMLMVNSFSMVPSLYKKLPYDTVADFTPISRVATSGYVFVVHAGALNVASMAELMAAVKVNPGKYMYGTPGNGTGHHLAMELFKQQFGLDLVHVPHKAMSGAMTSIVGGHVHMMFTPTGSVVPQIKAGQLRALAFTGAERSPIAPGVPTFREAGLGFLDDVDGYWGIMGPARTPPEIVTRLNRDVAAVMTAPDLKEKFAAQGIEPTSSTPEALGAQIRADIERWGKVIRNAGIVAD